MFGVILPSRPVLGPSTLQTVAENQFAYSFPTTPAFSHLVVFLLPENTLPPDVLAGIYIQFPPKDGSAAPSEFKLLGALSTVKPSAIFRVTAPRSADPAPQVVGEVGGMAEVDMDADEGAAAETATGGNITVGISVEPAGTLQPQLDALSQQSQAAGAGGAGKGQPSTKVLAQRIIQNAFNFLSGFAGGDGKVPLKSFEDWWKKFERRIEADPGFLEREEGE